MARSKTTFGPGNPHRRVGNGAGWGGPATGREPKRGPAEGAGRPKGGGEKTVATLMIEDGLRELTAQRWREILNDPAHPHHATMVAKAAERMDGMPVQPVDASIKQAVISAEPLSEEDWVATYGVGTAAGAAEGAS